MFNNKGIHDYAYDFKVKTQGTGVSQSASECVVGVSCRIWGDTFEHRHDLKAAGFVWIPAYGEWQMGEACDSEKVVEVAARIEAALRAVGIDTHGLVVVGDNGVPIANAVVAVQDEIDAHIRFRQRTPSVLDALVNGAE